MGGLEFTRVSRFGIGGENFGPFEESVYILLTPESAISIEDCLTPIYREGEERDRPKTVISFSNGTQVVVRGEPRGIRDLMKEWNYRESLGLDREHGSIS